MMFRFLFVITFFTLAAHSARADFVTIKGRDKPLPCNIISEDAKGIKVTPVGAKKNEDIPANDIIDIQYEGIKPGDLAFKGGSYREARDAEKESEDGATAAIRKKALDTALAKYEETLKKMNVKDTKGQVARHLQFKVAMLTLKKAINEEKSTDQAVFRLTKFKDAHPNSWQINTVMPTLASLHMEAKDFQAAVEVYDVMSGMEVFPLEVRRDAKLMIVQILVRGNKIDEANKKLDALAKEAGGNPAFESRVKMARAEVLIGQKKTDLAVPMLQQVLKENNDRQVKALAHNALGEILFNEKKFNEAMWEFLFVDAVFNQDKHQHAKALYFLAQVFQQLGDGPRAQECQQELLNNRRFSGTEHQRLMQLKTK